MKIAIDARMVEHSGVGAVLRGMVSQLVGLREEWGFELVFLGDPDKLKQYRYFGSGGAIVRWNAPIYSFREQLLPPCLPDIDLWHFPHYNVPLRFRQPFVVTIHDDIPLVRPEFANSWGHHIAVRWLISHALRHAAAVIVPSNATKQSLTEKFASASAKIHVIPHAPAPIFRPVDSVRMDSVIRNYGLRQPFFLCVSINKPHKNLPFLIRAFGAWAARAGNGAQLVLAGLRQQDTAVLQKEVEQSALPSAFRLLAGFIPEADLPSFYQAATALIVPSLYEGFGLPVLEAQKVGVPVVCSRAGSIPEVAGEAALYFDPTIEQDLCRQLDAIANDATLRASLISRGHANANQFDWNISASQIAKIYKQCTR